MRNIENEKEFLSFQEIVNFTYAEKGCEKYEAVYDSLCGPLR